jgi:hypothetical protein
MSNETNKKIIKEIKHEIIEENRDSLEIGTAKSGKIKIYCDLSKTIEVKKKIDNAVELRQYAKVRLEL